MAIRGHDNSPCVTAREFHPGGSNITSNTVSQLLY